MKNPNVSSFAYSTTDMPVKQNPQAQSDSWGVIFNVQLLENLGGLVWTDELDNCPGPAFMDSEPLPLGILKDLMDVNSMKKRRDEGHQIAGQGFYTNSRS